MPRLTGLDLAVRMLGLRPELPIVLASGYVDGVTASAVQSVGIREQIHKPVDSGVLTGALARALA